MVERQPLPTPGGPPKAAYSDSELHDTFCLAQVGNHTPVPYTRSVKKERRQAWNAVKKFRF